MKNPHAVRETLTRRQQGFRVKFPSFKMNVTIRCESLLERDAARYFEFAPSVKLFFHNAEKFEYYDQNGLPRRYYPDFVVELVDDRKERVEVKPKDVLLDPDNSDRYALIALRYIALGQSFKVLTDEFLRAEPLKSTLMLLAGHSAVYDLLNSSVPNAGGMTLNLRQSPSFSSLTSFSSPITLGPTILGGQLVTGPIYRGQ
jgi:hypothetical protein